MTGEANLTSVPAAADGAFPRATDVFVQGLLAGAAKRRSGATAAFGIAVSPEISPAASAFWPAVAAIGGAELGSAIDYAGLDMYPDVFGPRFGLDHLDGAVDWLMRSSGSRHCRSPGIGASVPIRIRETD